MRVIICFIISLYLSECQSYKTAALILARGGSKGVKLKNLVKVGGITLLERAIQTARIAGLDDVTVSTDHPLIALVALRSGAKIFLRNKVTASDFAPSIWGVSEFIDKNLDIDVLVLIQATSPFTQPRKIREGLDKIRQFDCVFSVTRSYKLRWKEYNGNIQSLNFDLTRRPRRQDWGGELLETGAFYIARRSIIDLGLLQNDNCTTVEIPPSEILEVDTYYDLDIANCLHSEYKK